MKASPECYACLERLARQAAMLATSDEVLRSRAIEEGLEVLKRSFSLDKVTIVVATEIHNVVKAVTCNPDPYQQMKETELVVAKEITKQSHPDGNSLYSCLKFAVLGNSVDFFKPLDEVREAVRQGVRFAIDDSELFEHKLYNARNVLYLADNAGEVFFDLPLVRWLKRRVAVTYVVKAVPVQDDITLDDIRRLGLENELGRIITTGTATPGVDLSQASAEFKDEFASADLVLAKGMGYWESLSELPTEGKIFYCLKAKCRPVAESLGVPTGSYVAKLL